MGISIVGLETRAGDASAPPALVISVTGADWSQAIVAPSDFLEVPRVFHFPGRWRHGLVYAFRFDDQRFTTMTITNDGELLIDGTDVTTDEDDTFTRMCSDYLYEVQGLIYRNDEALLRLLDVSLTAVADLPPSPKLGYELLATGAKLVRKWISETAPAGPIPEAGGWFPEAYRLPDFWVVFNTLDKDELAAAARTLLADSAPRRGRPAGRYIRAPRT